MLAQPGRFVRRYWLEALLLMPLTLYILLLTFVPVLQAIGMSFTDRYTGAFPTLSNYQYITSRPDFAAAFVNTLGITLIGVTLEMTFGLILALMPARAFPIPVMLATLFLQRYVEAGTLVGAGPCACPRRGGPLSLFSDHRGGTP